jgi:hypothetical protein
MGARQSRTDADANNLNLYNSNLIRKELNLISGGCPRINWGVSIYHCPNFNNTFFNFNEINIRTK